MKYANRMEEIKASEIREILKITQNPEIISFAGGLPAPELFPIDEIRVANDKVLVENGQQALQYATTEGYQPLRKWIANRTNEKFKTSFNEDDILITHGSQQALDLSGKIFLDKDDIVVCESPTYLAALTAFRMYEANFLEIECESDGMRLDILEEHLKTNDKIRFIYVIPDFQNPTGLTWSVEKRKKLVELSNKYKVPILEDNPYGELRFEGEHLPAVSSFPEAKYCIFTGTFSKIYCPGYRIGWVAAKGDIIKKYNLAKQSSDLQCNTMAQMAIYEYLKTFSIDDHIEKIKTTYRTRRDLAIDTMKKTFPSSVTFTNPSGGLFAWVELPEGCDTRKILEEALKRKVAFVPGGSFYPNNRKENTLRINFSNMSEDKIVKGLTILGEVLHEML